MVDRTESRGKDGEIACREYWKMSKELQDVYRLPNCFHMFPERWHDSRLFSCRFIQQWLNQKDNWWILECLKKKKTKAEPSDIVMSQSANHVNLTPNHLIKGKGMFVNVSVTHRMLIPLRKNEKKKQQWAKCFLLHNVACIHSLDCLCNSYISRENSRHLCVSQITQVKLTVFINVGES